MGNKLFNGYIYLVMFMLSFKQEVTLKTFLKLSIP